VRIEEDKSNNESRNIKMKPLLSRISNLNFLKYFIKKLLVPEKFLKIPDPGNFVRWFSDSTVAAL